MAYYTALIAKWATLTPGTTQQKLDQINAIVVTGSVPASFFTTGADVFNCIDSAEFLAKTAAQQTLVLQCLAVPGAIKGGAGSFLGGIFVAVFGVSGATITALTALAKAISQPWWQATVAQGGGGLVSLVSLADLAAAGGLS